MNCYPLQQAQVAPDTYLSTRINISRHPSTMPLRYLLSLQELLSSAAGDCQCFLKRNAWLLIVTISNSCLLGIVISVSIIFKGKTHPEQIDSHN